MKVSVVECRFLIRKCDSHLRHYHFYKIRHSSKEDTIFQIDAYVGHRQVQLDELFYI